MSENGTAAPASTPAIVPTVGRLVHIYDGRRWEGPRAAIIAGVNDDGTIEVNLCRRARDATVKAEELERVFLFSPTNGPEPEGLYAVWMPYQVGQAARTDAAESKLNPAVQGLQRSVDHLINSVESLGARVSDLHNNAMDGLRHLEARASALEAKTAAPTDKIAPPSGG